MAWLLSAACLAIAVFRRRVLCTAEAWILYNFAVILPFSGIPAAYDCPWLGVEKIAVGVGLARLLIRDRRPVQEYEHRLAAMLVVVYAIPLTL